MEFDFNPDQAALLVEKVKEVQREEERGTKDWELARQMKVQLNEEIHQYVCSYCGQVLVEDAIRNQEKKYCPCCSRCPDCGESAFEDGEYIHDCQVAVDTSEGSPELESGNQ